MKPFTALSNQIRMRPTSKFIRRVLSTGIRACKGLALTIRRYGWIPCIFASSLLVLTFSLSASAQEPNGKQDGEPSQLSQERAQQSQEQAPPSNPNPAIQSQPERKPADDQSAQDRAQDQEKSPQNDRLFGVLPNYLTVANQAKAAPLTAKGKFKLVSKDAFDPVIFPFIGFIALISQAQNSEPEFGQGAVGYGKRYGAAFGDASIGTFMTGAVFPSVFKQDPRYYQLAKGGVKRRAVYSLSRIFITRTDSGHRQFNSSELLGNLAAAGISNVYHPAQDRSFTNTLSIWGTGTGWDTISNLSKEFWPDIHQWLKHKF
jgi:hypothetical protein